MGKSEKRASDGRKRQREFGNVRAADTRVRRHRLRPYARPIRSRARVRRRAAREEEPRNGVSAGWRNERNRTRRDVETAGERKRVETSDGNAFTTLPSRVFAVRSLQHPAVNLLTGDPAVAARTAAVVIYLFIYFPSDREVQQRIWLVCTPRERPFILMSDVAHREAYSFKLFPLSFFLRWPAHVP